ncbi:MAG: hypothetical protein AAFV53_24750, partial [Myxococcota bacterium]
KDPGAVPDSDIAQYYLDAEVLRDDRRRERLWHIFYRHNLDRSSFFKTEDIFPLVTQAFLPKRDPDGQIRTRDASEIVAEVREGLTRRAGDIYREAMGERGMSLDLSRALALEQRYIALLDAREDIETLYKTGKLDESVRAVPMTTVRKGIQDKLQRLYDECVILANIDELQRDDPTVTPADVFYAGLSNKYDTEEDDSLGHLMRGVVSGINFVSGWEEDDAIVMYKAILGVPVYFFKNVESELQPAYRKIMRDPQRGYPLHIEHAWDAGEGLPDLDPIEMRRADERRQAEESARRARQSRTAKVERFALCNIMGNVVADEAGFSWNYEGMSQKLAPKRSEAFSAFDSMDPDLQQELVDTAAKKYRNQALERRPRARLLEDVKAYLKRLKKEMFAAAANYEDAEQRYIKEEREVVDSIVERLEAGDATLHIE